MPSEKQCVVAFPFPNALLRPQQHPALHNYYYTTNRFRILSVQSNPLRSTPKSIKIKNRVTPTLRNDQVIYSMCEGKEPLAITQHEPIPFAFDDSTTNCLSHVGVYIRTCCICNATSHTAVLCPLRKCCVCCGFGHGDSLCAFKRSAHSFDVDKTRPPICTVTPAVCLIKQFLKTKSKTKSKNSKKQNILPS